MKRTLLLLLFGLLVSLGHYTAWGQTGVKIKFFNKTGYDITDLTFLDKKIGLLKKNDSTSFLNFDSLLSCGFAPCTCPTGNIKNLNIDNRPKSYCGNNPYIKTGEIRNDIILISHNKELWLGRHKK